MSSQVSASTVPVPLPSPANPQASPEPCSISAAQLQAVPHPCPAAPKLSAPQNCFGWEKHSGTRTSEVIREKATQGTARQAELEWGSCITAAPASPAPGERKTAQGAGGGWRGCTALPGRCSRGQEPQEVSCSPVPEGTARSLLSVTLLWISPALCPHTLCTHFFFPYSDFGCLSADPLRVESCRVKRSSRLCCLGSSPHEIKPDFVAVSKYPHKQHQEPHWCPPSPASLVVAVLVHLPQSDERAAPRTDEVSDCTTCPQSLRGNSLGLGSP